MKTLPTQRWNINPWACAIVVLVSSGWPLSAQTNSIAQPVKQIKLSTAPLQLQPALQAKAQTSIPGPRPFQAVSLVPVTLGTAVLAVLAWEPAQNPSRGGSNQAVLKGSEPRTGGAAAQQKFASGPGAHTAVQEPSVSGLELVRPRPRLSFGSDDPLRVPLTEKPPGWVFLSIRF